MPGVEERVARTLALALGKLDADALRRTDDLAALRAAGAARAAAEVVLAAVAEDRTFGDLLADIARRRKGRGSRRGLRGANDRRPLWPLGLRGRLGRIARLGHIACIGRIGSDEVEFPRPHGNLPRLRRGVGKQIDALVRGVGGAIGWEIFRGGTIHRNLNCCVGI